MNFETLLATIPYRLDELGSIPRASERWKLFLNEQADERTFELYLSPSLQPEVESGIAISFYWAVKSDVVLVAEKSAQNGVFVVPILFDSFNSFIQWLGWRLLVVYGHHEVDCDFVTNQLEGLQVSILGRPHTLKSGEGMRCMETDRLDLL